MALWVHVHGGYPSYAGSGEQWIGSDYEAMKFVKALKGLPFNGHASLRTPTGFPVTIRATDRSGAFRIFGEWATAKLAELELSDAVVMAVPSSSCLAMNGDEKGRALTAAVKQRSPNITVVEGLWWKAQLPKAAQGGTRDSSVLEANLNVLDGPPSRVVLVDDVVSSGGHLRACARALRAKGHSVEHALCAAQTVNNHPENMWKIDPRDLEANPFESFSFEF